MSSGHPRPLLAKFWLTPKTGFTLSFFLTVVNQLVMLFSLPLLAAAVAYSMFWLPQIARSAITGRNSALTTEYLVGTTICRLLFAFCMYLAKPRFFLLTFMHTDYLNYSENIMEISPRREWHSSAAFSSNADSDIAWIWSFGSWIVFQVFFIQLQDLYGPAFFLPARVSHRRARTRLVFAVY